MSHVTETTTTVAQFSFDQVVNALRESGAYDHGLPEGRPEVSVRPGASLLVFTWETTKAKTSRPESAAPEARG